MNKSGNEYLKIKLWKNIQIFSTFMKKKYSDIQYFHEEKNRGFEIFLFWAERISAFLQFRQLTKTSEKFSLNDQLSYNNGSFEAVIVSFY